MKNFVLLVNLAFLSIGFLQAQVVIGPNTQMTVNGTLVVNGAVINQSASSQFIATDLSLTGGDQNLSTVTPVALSSLSIEGGGTKTLTGSWEVDNFLNLSNGIIVASPDAKLLYSGSQAITVNTGSYIVGYFYSRGTGDRLFPIGTLTAYAPVIIKSTQDKEYGVQVVTGDPELQLPDGVTDNFKEHYWEFNSPPNAALAVSLIGMDALVAEGTPVIIEAASTGTIGSFIPGNVSDNFLAIQQPINNSIISVGIIPEFKLIIHDMITPFTADNVNDKLYIEKLELTSSNKVTLIDKYGVVVKEWVDYSNDIDFDFQRFNPGYYVCVVEYTDPSGNKSTARGSITILKAN